MLAFRGSFSAWMSGTAGLTTLWVMSGDTALRVFSREFGITVYRYYIGTMSFNPY